MPDGDHSGYKAMTMAKRRETNERRENARHDSISRVGYEGPARDENRVATAIVTP